MSKSTLKERWHKVSFASDLTFLDQAFMLFLEKSNESCAVELAAYRRGGCWDESKLVPWLL